MSPDGSRRSSAAKFSGPYSHQTLEGGVGHNLPQEAPEAFADAIRMNDAVDAQEPGPNADRRIAGAFLKQNGASRRYA